MSNQVTHNQHSQLFVRSGPQKVCLAIGYFLFILGLSGMILPGVGGMHLSITHNLIHILSGALALWSAYQTNSNSAFYVSLISGVFYGFLGIAGLIFGSPGYPGVGYMEADEKLFKIIPNSLEFGTADHLAHILLSIAFLFSCSLWKKDHSWHP